MKWRSSRLYAALLVCTAFVWLVGCHGGSDQAALDAAVVSSTQTGSEREGGVRTAEAQLLGDMDGDGAPGVSDAIAILRIVVGIDPDSPVADANRNGGTDVGDAILVLRCVVGLDEWPLGDMPSGTITVIGYVGSGAQPTQSASAPALQLLTTPPTLPIQMARVVLVGGGQTVEVRALVNGFFSAVLPAGVVTITAYPPENQTAQHSPSAPSLIAGDGGDVVLVDGTTADEPNQISPAEFMVYDLGDKRATQLTSWDEDSGDDEFHVSTDWLGLVIGTTQIDGVTAMVTADPRGASDGVLAMQQEGAIVVANDSKIVHANDDGSLTMYGMCTIVRNPDGSFEAIGTLFDPAVVYPAMRLGAEYNTTLTATRQVIDVDLIPGLSLGDLYDAEYGDAREMDPLPTEPVLWSVRLTGTSIPAETPAGVFSDTITISWTLEQSRDGEAVTQTSQEVYARGIGLVAMDNIMVARAEGALPGTGRVTEVSFDCLLYAKVGGTQYGTAPQQ